jgi:PAS domain S-box-containing protein
MSQTTERNTNGENASFVPWGDGAAWAELFDRSVEHVVAVDATGTLRFANRSWHAALERDAETKLPHLREVVPVRDLRRWEQWLRHPESLQCDVPVQFSWRHPRGWEIPVEGNLSPVRGADAAGGGVVGLFQDLRPLTEARARWEETEAVLRPLMHYAPIGIFQMDQRGHLLHTNARWRKIAGLDYAPEPQGVWWQMVDPADRSTVLMQWESFLRHGHEFVSEFRVRSGGRGAAYARVRIVQTQPHEAHGVACIGVAEDITEQKRLEADRLAMETQLRQQQKLESIGTLASGVAHEINNPMTGIINYAEIIRESLPPESDAARFAAEIIREGQRVSTIVRNLLTFARQEKQEHAPTAPQAIIEDTLSLIRTIIKRDHVRLEKEVAEDLPLIRCQSQQIQQVLMNLLTNGRDALNAKYPDYHPDKILRVTASRLRRNGRPWVRITVEDHGTGITPDVAERMYEPFYTTKSGQKGTGLGMAISLGIVQAHHGELRMETEPGHFTRFHLELPALVASPVSPAL